MYIHCRTLQVYSIKKKKCCSCSDWIYLFIFSRCSILSFFPLDMQFLIFLHFRKQEPLIPVAECSKWEGQHLESTFPLRWKCAIYVQSIYHFYIGLTLYHDKIIVTPKWHIMCLKYIFRLSKFCFVYNSHSGEMCELCHSSVHNSVRLSPKASQSLFFTAGISTCDSRRSTGVTNSINNGAALFKQLSKAWQCDSELESQYTRILKVKHLNEIQFIIYTSALTAVEMSSARKTCGHL